MSSKGKTAFFLFSPLLNIPALIFGVYKKSKTSVYLFALLFGVLSYLYVPSYTNDKVRYLELYQTINTFGFDYLVSYLSRGRPDFILHYLIFICTYFSIPFRVLFFFITSFTVWAYLYTYIKIFYYKYGRRQFFIGFVLITLSFSWPDLFSGTRFYFASAFVLLSFYYGIYERKIVKPILLLLIGVFIHFSMAVFFPVFFLIKFFPYINKTYRTIFLISFAFIFAPKGLIGSVIDSLGLSGGFASKADVYLEGEDFLERGIDAGGISYYLRVLLNNLWIYVAYIYLLFFDKEKSKVKNLTLLSFAVINLFYAVPTVYSRYILFVKILFILYIMSTSYFKRNTVWQVIFVGIFLLAFIANLVILRYNLIESFFDARVLTLIQMIFINDLTLEDVLY